MVNMPHDDVVEAIRSQQDIVFDVVQKRSKVQA